MFDRSTIRLAAALRERAIAAASKAGYSSVDEFVAHAVEKELARLDAPNPPELTEVVANRLRGLGYLE